MTVLRVVIPVLAAVVSVAVTSLFLSGDLPAKPTTDAYCLALLAYDVKFRQAELHWGTHIDGKRLAVVPEDVRKEYRRTVQEALEVPVPQRPANLTARRLSAALGRHREALSLQEARLQDDDEQGIEAAQDARHTAARGMARYYYQVCPQAPLPNGNWAKR